MLTVRGGGDGFQNNRSGEFVFIDNEMKGSTSSPEYTTITNDPAMDRNRTEDYIGQRIT